MGGDSNPYAYFKQGKGLFTNNVIQEKEERILVIASSGKTVSLMLDSSGLHP